MTKLERAEWEKAREQENQEVLKCKDSCRILQALQRKPLGYSRIKRLLNFKPDRLESLLKKLYRGMWVVGRVVPNKVFVKFYAKFHELHKNEPWNQVIPVTPPKNCKLLAVYELTKRGASVLSAKLKRPRKTVIATPFPLAEKTAKRLGVSKKRVKWIIKEAKKAS